jgi:hypothetical protein
MVSGRGHEGETPQPRLLSGQNEGEVEGRRRPFQEESDWQTLGLFAHGSVIDQEKSSFASMHFHSQFSMSLTVNRYQDRLDEHPPNRAPRDRRPRGNMHCNIGEVLSGFGEKRSDSGGYREIKILTIV